MGRTLLTLTTVISAFLTWFGQPALAVDVPSHEVELVGPAGLIRSDNEFTVEVRLTSLGEEMNAAEIHVHFQPTEVEFVRVSREQSIFTLWPEEPKETNGDISLVGGRPGGLLSVGGSVATLYLKPRHSGPTGLSVDTTTSAVYLNDGQATRREVASRPLQLHIADQLADGIMLTSTSHPTPDTWSSGRLINVHWSAQKGSVFSYELSTNRLVVPDDTTENPIGDVTYDTLDDGVYYFTIKERSADGVWSPVIQRRFLLDSTPPEPFTIDQVLGKFAGGKPLLTWQSTDITSGIAGYTLTVDGRLVGTVKNPAILKSTWLGHDVTITAADAAGNTTQSRIAISSQHGTDQQLFIEILSGVSAIILSSLLLYIARRRRSVASL